MKKGFRKQKNIIFTSLLIILCVLFIPFVRIPKDKTFVVLDNHKLTYNNYIYDMFGWSDLDENSHLTLNSNQFSYDYVPQKIERIFSDDRTSLFGFFAGSKYYSAGNQFIFVNNVGVGFIPLVENFVYSNGSVKYPTFETYNISRIDVVCFEEYFNSNWDLESHKSDFLKYVYDKEARRKVLLKITNKTDINEFVKEIKYNSSVENFYKKVALKESVEAEFYFRVVFQDPETPFCLSIYSQETIGKVFS